MITDWADEAVEKAEILRLIYQGRFLHSNVTLGALGLVPARTTVMHLVPRETLPEPNSQGETYNKLMIFGHWLRSRMILPILLIHGQHLRMLMATSNSFRSLIDI